MKTWVNLGISIWALLASAILGHAQTINTTSTNISAPTQFSIVQRAENQRIWQRTFSEVLPSGQTVLHAQQYTEVANGICYLGTDAQWHDSQEVINVSAAGASATNGVFQAFFPPDIYEGVIQLKSGDISLSAQPQYITYSDGTNYAVIAELTNSVGELISSNELLYPGAFSGPGVDADLMMTYRRSGVEQDVIFRTKPPAPEQFGLSSANTRLQLTTAFFDVPAPQATAEPMNSQDELQDTTLTFGGISMIQGRAFLIGNTGDPQVPIYKNWQSIDANTSVLVEQLPYSQIAASLATLPARVSSKKSIHSPLRKVASRWDMPSAKRSRTSTNTVKMVRIKQRPGFTLDYITINGQSLTNYVFTGDNLFFVSGPVYLYGTTVLEGGSVIKANTSGVINIMAGGTVDCQTGPYFPTMFTSDNDNAVAYGIGSGSPVMGDVNTFLNFYSTNVVLHDLHFAYALNAVNQAGAGSTSSINLWDSEFVDVDTAVNAYNIGLYNVLIGRTALTNAAVIVDGVGSLVGENVTADYGNEFIQATNSGTTIALTNCLVTRQPLLITGSTATLQTNAVVCLTGLTLSPPVYQVCGGGSYYLTNSSPYATNGTPNIDPDLLGDLQQKTVWPPTVYADTNISFLNTLSPSVPRDTNAYPAIGFNYNPLDVVFGGADLTNNLTVTAGTAVGWFEETGTVSVSGQPYGMTLNNGANLTFNGTATQPCYWSQYAMVQERGSNNWNGAGYMGSFTFNGSSGSQEPLLTANFTKFTMGNLMILLRDNSALGAGSFKNCEIDNATIGTFDMQYLTFTNCLFFRDSTVVYNSSYTLNLTNDNCTYYNGGLGLARVTGQNSYWSIENTIFDGTQLAFYDEYNGATNQTFFEYNAFNTNNLSWETYPFPYSNWTLTNTLEDLGSSDLLTSNFQWERSWFGDFYLPTNSQVLRMGSTNANFLGLYHFTTQTNQIAEGTNRVTIGYHYVATDTNGLPLDSNGDGIPDYLEDANGDGLVDDGETNWALAILTQPVSQIAVPGTNADFYVGADGVAPLTYQWYFNGTNLSWATNATLVITNAQATNEGLYFAVVSNFSGSLTSSVVALEPFGLIGWWPGESNALDNAGPNNGNLMDGTSFTNGVLGQAFQFDGTNNYILVPDSPILKPTNLTIEAWVRFSSLATREYGDFTVPDLQIIAEKPDINQPSPDNGFYNDGYTLFKQLGADGINDNFEFGVTKSDGETEQYAIDSALGIQTNVWYFVAGVRGSNYIQIYVNGQLSGQTNVDFDQSYGAAPLYLGSLGEPDIFDVKLKGSLDEVALYNRALSSNEIQETYNAELLGIRNCLVPPVIITQPSSQYATEGTTATLLVAAAGSPPLSCQWSFNGTNIAGATNATLILPGVQATNTGYYSVVVSNNEGSVTSIDALLTVDTCFPSVDGALVIDDSCLMTNLLNDGTPDLTAAQIAATNFVRALNFTNDQAALYSFNDDVTSNQVLTDSSPNLLNAIGSLASVPDTDPFMGNALQISQSELVSPRHNPGALPVMVFLSGEQPDDINFGEIYDPPVDYSGLDFPDTSNLVLEAATLVKAAGTRLITIALGTNADPDFMALMATSPGDSYYATNRSQLTNVFNLIADSICRGTNTSPANTLSVQITAPSTNQTFNAGSNILISAIASNSISSLPVAYVEFFVGTNILGGEANTNTFTNTLYQTYWLPLNAGTNVLRAYAVATNGSETWTAWSQSVTNYIRGLPAITITSPVSGTNLGSMYKSTLITASVTTASGATVTNVSYFTNGVFMGANLSLPYQTNSPLLAAGVYTLYATATDTNGAMGTSSNIIITVEPPNQPPFVYAGPNQVTNLPSALLTGFVSDDGLPSNYLAATWSLVSGPIGQTAMFANSNQPQTTVTFSIAGTNVLQLMATDGSLTNTGQVQIIVVETNLPPKVNAGTNQTVLLPESSGTNLLQFQSLQLTMITNVWDSSINGYPVPNTGYPFGGMDYMGPSNSIIFSAAGADEDGNLYPSFYLAGANGTSSLFWGTTNEFDDFWNFAFWESLVTARVTSGGFTNGEIFCSYFTPGVIMRMEPDGTLFGNNGEWGILTNSTINETANDRGFIISVCLDTTGVWGGDLLALTYSGDVWRVNSTGHATFITTLTGFDATTSGMATIPNNVPKYGPWAGRILISGETWYTVDTNDFVVPYNPPTLSNINGAGKIEVVPQNENLYGWNPSGSLWSFSASQLEGMAGDILEWGAEIESTYDNPLYEINWNGSNFNVTLNFQINQDNTDPLRTFTFCPAGLTNVPAVPSRIQLNGAISDDGRLFSPTSNYWDEISGPGPMTFDDPTLTNTFAEFIVPGIYILRLTAFDGQFTSYSNVEITVLSNPGLTVNAGTNQMITTLSTTLSGAITDTTGLTNEVALEWSQISGPSGSTASFAWNSTTTNLTVAFASVTNTVSFPATGTYVLQLSGSDGRSSASNQVTILVQTPYFAMTPGYGLPTLTNTSFTVTAVLMDSNNVPVAGTNVSFFISGANGNPSDKYDPNGSATTTSGGSASFTYAGTNQGRDIITAVATVDGQVVSNFLAKDWALGISCGSTNTASEIANFAADTAAWGWYPESVSIDTPTNGLVNYADYYMFYGVTGSVVTFTCAEGGDLGLALRDSSGNLVASGTVTINDYTQYPQLTCSLPSSGYYIVEVSYQSPVNYNNPNGLLPPSFELGMSCDNDTNGLLFTWPQLEVLLNGTNITSGGTITFPPSIALEDATTDTLLLTNCGLESLTINSVGTNGDFSFTNDLLFPITIAPGGSMNLGAVFNASANGPAIGQFVLYGTMPVSGNYQAYLSAGVFSTGAPPAITITSPRNLASYFAPASIPITATISSDATNVASVTFEATTTNGTVSIGNGSSITTNEWGLTWPEAVTGNYTITAVATDVSGRTTTSPSINITVNPFVVTNIPPILTNFTTSVQANSINNVLNPLSTARDLNGNPMTIVSISQPQNGTATIINNGAEISYSPRPGYYSESVGGTLQPFDIFSYEVSDGHGGTSTAEITIFVDPNVPPVVSITSPASPASVIAGAVTNIVATITNIPAQYLAQVDFYLDGSNLVGAVTNGTSGAYTLTWTNIYSFNDDGVETFVAEASDIFGDTAISPPLTIDVQAPTGNVLVAELDSAVGSQGTNDFALAGSTADICYIRDGVFQLFGKATNSNPNVTWTLAVYSADGSMLIRNLTPASTGPVGTASSPGLLLNNCDLTTLQNGIYDLRLTVIGGGEEKTSDVYFALESNLKIGEFSFSQQDLVIPVNGIPLTVTRTYNSQNPDKGDFGYGWTYTLSDMDVALDETRADEPDINGHTFSARTGGGRDITLTLPNGQRTTFYYNPTYLPGSIQFIPEWETAPGQPRSLGLVSGPNSAQREDYWEAIYESDGGEPYWEDPYNASDVPDEVYDFPSFTLMTPDGTKYILDRPNLGKHTMSGGASGDGYEDQAYGTPYLAQIQELNGNTISMNSNGIVFVSRGGAATNQITFQRNSLGLISSISDPNSIVSNGPPAMKYEYDANGNLLDVQRLTDRTGTGTYVTNTFTYTNADYPHYITGVINADGTQIAKTVYNSSGQVVEIDDAYGNITQEIHDSTNDTETVIDPLNHSTTSVYDTLGNVIAQTNALDEVTTMIYDPNNNKTNTVTYLPNGQPYATNSAVYNGNNNLLSSVDPLGHTNGFTYNGFGQVLSSSDSLGNTTSNSYDGFGNLTGTSDALSNTTVNTYGDGGIVTSEDPIQTLTTNTYDPQTFNLIASATLDASWNILSSNTYTYDADNNRLTSTVWRRTNGVWTAATTTNVYDGQNRMIETINPDGGISTINYNVDGEQAETTDALGNVTSNSYDALGHLIQTTYPDGTTTSSAYDADGNRTNSVDQLGRTTTYVYDALNRLVETIYPDGATNGTVYDAFGRVAQNIDARGTITANAYDVAGREVAVTNAVGTSVVNTNYYSYDADGNQIMITDADGHTTTNVYDVLNRQIQVQYPDGTMTETIYDSDGRSIARINQDNVTNKFGYDGSGRLISVTNALGQVTRYQYDEAGNETTQIDALLRTNTYTYDGMGRRIGHTMPGGQSEGFAFDVDGNQIYHTNFNGAVIANLYDEDNRLTNTSSAFGYHVSFAYSATGQRTAMADPSGQTAYTYDLRDRLLQKSVSWDSGPAVSLNYAYDANGNVTNIASTTTNGVNLAYAYDPLNRLTNVLDHGNPVAGYAYDLVGNLQGLRYGNGVTNQYQYDSLNRLTNLTWNLNFNTLAKFSYLLGATGNRTNLNESVGGTNRLYTWQYDRLYQLTNENENSLVSPSGNLAYQFDSVGNRTNRQSTISQLPTASYSYTTNDWLTTDKYDLNGNTTNSGTSVYQYDVMNHVTNATVSGTQILMSYDGDGTRVSKTVSGVTTYYLVDNMNPSGYSQVLEEYRGSSLTNVYNYGLSLISQRTPSVSTNYFVSDGHGSTRMLTDNGGNIVNVFAYDAFGNLIAFNGVLQTAYLYSGQQFDPDLELYLNRARYLNPGTGRFWTADSTEGDNEDPISLHKYLYGADDPVNLDDPSGNDPTINDGFDVMLGTILNPVRKQVSSQSNLGAYTPSVTLSTSEPNLMLERLFLAEVESPTKRYFSLSEAVTSIYAMGSVIYDRCLPAYVGYPHLHFGYNHQHDIYHIVTQRGQFAGFEHYTYGVPNGALPTGIVDVINGDLADANIPSGPDFQSYRVLVLTSKEVAQQVIHGQIFRRDPFAPIRPFGWMTAGSAGPGGSFYPIGTLAGNTFYGVR